MSSWNWSAESPTTIGSATSGAGAGKASFKEFTISKNIDNTSTTLYSLLATGKNIPTLTFKVGSTLTYTFSTAFVTKVEQSGDGADGNENVTFVYGAMSMGNATAGSTPPVYCWSQILNKQC